MFLHQMSIEKFEKNWQ